VALVDWVAQELHKLMLVLLDLRLLHLQLLDFLFKLLAELLANQGGPVVVQIALNQIAVELRVERLFLRQVEPGEQLIILDLQDQTQEL
jgi:hypothetical protein